MSWWDNHIEQIKAGGRPPICGRGLSDSQIVDIARELFMSSSESRHELARDIEYFKHSVLVKRIK